MSTNSPSISTAPSPPTTVDVLDEIERLEQSITRTLQEIDQSFSDCQIIVSSKILPQIDRYAESSVEVWNHARLWLGFLEAAAAPSLPSAPRIRPPSRWDEREAGAAEEVTAQGQRDGDQETGQQSGDPQEHERLSISSAGTLQLEPDNDTNRRRISMFSLSPAGGLPDGFLGSSPGHILPSPTPNSRQTQSSLARTLFRDHNQGSASTPSRRGMEMQGSATALSTTPKGKPDSRPTTRGITTAATTYSSSGDSMHNPFTAPSHGTPRKGVRVLDSSSRGMVVLDVDQDYQDVITPPKTLQFSVPESKVATTPRSVLEKSKVDRIFMKDGLVVPRPIFTRLDESESGESSTVSRLHSQQPADIGESRKRRREGDHQDPGSVDDDLEEHAAVSWEPGATSRSAKAVASPRKIPGTRSIFSSGITSERTSDSSAQRLSTGTIDLDVEEQGEGGSLSPSERLMASLREQSQQEERGSATTATTTPRKTSAEDIDDPILASLKTPPELRQNLLAYKTRMSLIPQGLGDFTQASRQKEQKQQQPSQSSQETNITSQQEASSARVTAMAGPDLNHFTKQTTGSTSSAASPSTTARPIPDDNAPIVTSAPAPAPQASRQGSLTPMTNNDMAARSFASIFASNPGAVGSTTLRRQTLALSSLGSSGNNNNSDATVSNASNTRASIGGGGGGHGGFTNRPAFQAIQPPFGRLMNTPTIFSAVAQQQLRRDIQPSPASRAAAAAIAGTTATSAADVTPWSASTPTPKGSEPAGQQQDRGASRASQLGLFSLTSTPQAGTSGRGHSSGSGGDVTQVSSRGIYSASRPSAENTSNSILTPFSRRDPPPAPRLGYYSDTLMTQSSLGLNHDGFGPHSEDHTTNTRINVDSTTGISRATMTSNVSSGSRMMPPPSSGGRTSSSARTSGIGSGTGSSGGMTDDHSGLMHPSSDGDATGQSDDITGSMEDEDTTSYQIRSPCPPGKSGAGSLHQPLSLAALRKGPFSKPK